ncbi:MAG: mechanosensitive ion channel [Sphingobacteriales bacterium]|nr:MAG: mechanosensitive ion channel [Sphingobacteriales bacterium]
MEEIITFKDVITASFLKFIQSFMDALPSVLAAFLLLLLGWFFARIVSFLIIKFLSVVKFNTLASRISATRILEKANIQLSPVHIVSKFAYWLILLLFFVTATDTLGWTIVSEQISKLIGFLPTLLSGIVIFIIGLYIATFFKEIVAAATTSLSVTGGRIISGFVFYFLVVIISITALDQIGIDTSIITSNVVLILGAILLAASISYGIASKTILANMLAAFYSRKTFRVGQYIRIDDIEGEILSIDTIALTLQTETDKVVIPTHELISKRVHIISEM